MNKLQALKCIEARQHYKVFDCWLNDYTISPVKFFIFYSFSKTLLCYEREKNHGPQTQHRLSVIFYWPANSHFELSMTLTANGLPPENKETYFSIEIRSNHYKMISIFLFRITQTDVALKQNEMKCIHHHLTIAIIISHRGFCGVCVHGSFYRRSIDSISVCFNAFIVSKHQMRIVCARRALHHFTIHTQFQTCFFFNTVLNVQMCECAYHVYYNINIIDFFCSYFGFDFVFLVRVK